MKYYKKVLMPIEVSYGDFCFGDGRVCGHFSCKGGAPDCNLGFYIHKFDNIGRVVKSDECKNLQNI